MSWFPTSVRSLLAAVATVLRRFVFSGFVVTRHGALIAARSLQSASTKRAARARSTAERLALVLLGSVFIGLGVSLFIHARLGLPPYDVLLSAIVDRTMLTHGQAGWALSGGLLALVSVLGRPPSWYGIVFVVANGASVDGWTRLLVDPSGLGARLLFVALGIAAIAGGVAVVAHSSSTGGPYELLTLAAADKGLNPTIFRSVLEFSTVALGVGLGGALGLGTLAFVIAIGPGIAFASQALADRRDGRQQRLQSVAGR